MAKQVNKHFRIKVKGLCEEFKAFTKEWENPFKLGDDLLYKMCEEHPNHVKLGDAISKVWLIGRSYAAAIERTSSGIGDKGGNFYVDWVGPILQKRAKEIELDKHLRELKRHSGDFIDNAEKTMALHQQMVSIFRDISGMDKRSLASKYLHFHCPGKVLIYDSRACEAANAIVDLSRGWSEMFDNQRASFDEPYAKFVAKVIVIAKEIFTQIGIRPDPRMIDSFLLHHIYPTYCK